MKDPVRNFTGQTDCPQEFSCGADVSKQALRRQKLALRQALTSAFRSSADFRIRKRLSLLLSTLSGFDTVVGYLSDGTEPDLMPLLRDLQSAGKKLCLPRFRSAEHYDLALTDSPDNCAKRVFGIPEPPESAKTVPAKLLKNAVWLVPGVAFDASCARIGRGKGVYDRLLAECGDTISIGIFYECQKCDPCPVSLHDRFLNAIVTEDQTYLRTTFRFQTSFQKKEKSPSC